RAAETNLRNHRARGRSRTRAASGTFSRRHLLRSRRRSIRGRRRTGILIRLCVARRRRTGALRASLGFHARRRAPRVRALHRLRHRSAQAVSRPACLSLRALRAEHAETTDGTIRDARRRARSSLARARLRRSVRHRQTSASRRRGKLQHQAPRAALRLRPSGGTEGRARRARLAPIEPRARRRACHRGCNVKHDRRLQSRRLRDWLESIRTGLIDDGADIARPVPQDDAPSEALDERQRRVQALAERLRDDVPDDRLERTAEQHARWIMSHTLDFHRREDKSVWWEYFRLAALSDEDLMEERCAIAGLEFVATVGGTKAAPVHRYRFPPQDTDLRGGETLHMPGEAPLGKVEAISFEQR